MFGKEQAVVGGKEQAVINELYEAVSGGLHNWLREASVQCLVGAGLAAWPPRKQNWSRETAVWVEK